MKQPQTKTTKSAEWVEPFMDGYVIGSEGKPASVPDQYAPMSRHWLAGWDAGDLERQVMVAEGTITQVKP